MHQPPKNLDVGLWKRGLLLFGAMAVIAGIALFVALRRPSVQTTDTPLRPELLQPMLVVAHVGFPAHVNWGILYKFSEAMPSPKGWETRYNATLALARGGSHHLFQRLDVLREMLDEQRQLVNFRVRRKDGKFVQDEAAARRTVLAALDAFEKWHKKTEKQKRNARELADLERVYQAMERLTRSDNNVVRDQAKRLLKKVRHG